MQQIQTFVRSIMSRMARVLNQLSGGKLRPYHITAVSLIGHIPAAWAFATYRPYLGALLLLVFSLLDALDGALAREQKSTSLQGMFADAVSDRVKEVLIYTGLTIYVVDHIGSQYAWLPVCVVGLSLLVSYVKAKGEMAVSGSQLDKQALNRLFGGGIASYDVRTAILLIAIITDKLVAGMLLLIILCGLTVISRYIRILRALNESPKKNDTR